MQLEFFKTRSFTGPHVGHTTLNPSTSTTFFPACGCSLQPDLLAIAGCCTIGCCMMGCLIRGCISATACRGGAGLGTPMSTYIY